MSLDFVYESDSSLRTSITDRFGPCVFQITSLSFVYESDSSLRTSITARFGPGVFQITFLSFVYESDSSLRTSITARFGPGVFQITSLSFVYESDSSLRTSITARFGSGVFQIMSLGIFHASDGLLLRGIYLFGLLALLLTEWPSTCKAEWPNAGMLKAMEGRTIEVEWLSCCTIEHLMPNLANCAATIELTSAATVDKPIGPKWMDRTVLNVNRSVSTREGRHAQEPQARPLCDAEVKAVTSPRHKGFSLRRLRGHLFLGS
ncbi:hypothetical protein LR48_Vigan03g218300 [Vigna angularis]|uniref:Uncharacterized protein n=1 Tax=Phaseolus angularis TaxID=3914 RepID=A0A0L9U7U3_PHAAN|nr:hypothetical protein LR48_Vigan03g218300 [Vigna angularis]